jgi:hypothetical protein
MTFAMRSPMPLHSIVKTTTLCSLSTISAFTVISFTVSISFLSIPPPLIGGSTDALLPYLYPHPSVSALIDAPPQYGYPPRPQYGYRLYSYPLLQLVVQLLCNSIYFLKFIFHKINFEIVKSKIMVLTKKEKANITNIDMIMS